MPDDWPAVRDRVADRTDRVLADLRERWGTDRTVDPFEYGPRQFDPDGPPESVDGQLERLAGIASVVVFYTDAREETVLVFNPSGHWEPPGGAIEADRTPEETVHVEAHEETGLEIELTDLLYTGRFELQYRDGSSVPLPLAQFVGHRVGGSLTVERERIDHPGVTRATGVFDRELLPDCRERGEILELMER